MKYHIDEPPIYAKDDHDLLVKIREYLMETAGELNYILSQIEDAESKKQDSTPPGVGGTV